MMARPLIGCYVGHLIRRSTRRQRISNPCRQQNYSSSNVTAIDDKNRKKKDKYNKDEQDGVNKTRVIGIMAHIDAGKTTTTERMLYYSGFQSTVGEVHHGDTTMDYLEQERDRGITIQSAAVTFPWRGHTISLVDTPGHVDFTMEVERCIRVVDGAVAVVDASAGVEAQTTTVWRQADVHGVPRLVYLNKMDKPGASVNACVEEVRRKLDANPLLIQLPLGAGKGFRGVLDLVTGRHIEWADHHKNERGAVFTVSEPIIQDDPLWAEYTTARMELCDALGDIWDPLADHILDTGRLDTVPAHMVHAALKEATGTMKCVPVLLGSSYKNIGVQPLLDGVLNYLPGPLARLPAACSLYSPGVCCLAFKIVHDKCRGGLLTFVRVYSGTLVQGDRVYNVSSGSAERPTGLLLVLADEYKEVPRAGPGSIVVLQGLKKTSTGDTLVSSAAHVVKARERLAKRLSKTSKDSDANPGRVTTPIISEDEEGNPIATLAQDEQTHLLVGVNVPEPVFFCSVEAAAPRFQKALEEALATMQREDPSLRVKHDPETGQLVVAGMGELHLEVVASRIKSQYGVEADIGPLQVAYREEISNPGEKTICVDKTIGDSRQLVTLGLCIEHSTSRSPLSRVSLKHTKDNAENLSTIRRPVLNAVTTGVTAALSNGPVLGCPVHQVAVSVTWLEAARRTAPAFVSAVAAQCVRQLLTEQCGCRLSEPIMRLSVTGEEDYCQQVVTDLSKRRSQVTEVTTRNGVKHVEALVPLAEVIGYSSAVRKLTSGRASFTMELHSYRSMTEMEQREAIKAVTGFYPA